MELKKGIKKSSIRIFEKSGHSPFIEGQAVFSRTVMEWVATSPQETSGDG
jgi:hypothetical protein